MLPIFLFCRAIDQLVSIQEFVKGGRLHAGSVPTSTLRIPIKLPTKFLGMLRCAESNHFCDYFWLNWIYMNNASIM